MGACILASFGWAIEPGYDLEHARTFALTVLVALNFFQAYNSRTQYRSLFTINPFGNPLLAISAFGSLLLQWGAMSWDVSAGILGLHPWALRNGAPACSSGRPFIIIELEKLFRRRNSSKVKGLVSESRG